MFVTETSRQGIYGCMHCTRIFMSICCTLIFYEHKKTYSMYIADMMYINPLSPVTWSVSGMVYKAVDRKN